MRTRIRLCAIRFRAQSLKAESDFAFAALIYPKVAKPKVAPKRKAKAKSKGKTVRKSKVKRSSGRKKMMRSV
jgi:hypothetical protein